jgi:single-stranded-DNA-specific exonuclease
MKLRTRAIDHLALARLTDQGLDPLRARLFASRGVRNRDDCDLSIERMLPPRMMGLEAAAERVAEAIIAGAAIVVVGDYDCDGATGVACAVSGLRALGATIDYLVPSRFADGYGLSPRVVDAAAEHPRVGRAALIVTVDNGIGAIAGVERANALGIPVIVTDHHLPGPVLPAAAAIVDPNQAGCPFPAKSIAGVGVMFYLVVAVRARLRALGRFAAGSSRKEPALAALLDLVALGTVADIVALDQNNRRFIAAGLGRIRSGRARPGIQALFQVAGRAPRQATAADLGYLIGPRVNAAGRLADMSLGIECLLAPDADAARQMAEQLDHLNRERRDIEAGMNAQAQAATIDCPPDRRTLVVFDAGWHHGVIGLVASRIKDRHHRPCIALAPEAAGDCGGPLRGSGRSIAGIHLRDVLDVIDRRHPGLLQRFGGHAMAAGLTLAPGRVEELSAAFEAAVTAIADAEVFERELLTDGPLSPAELSLATAERIDTEVWGQGFAPPLFSGRFRVLQQRLIQDRHLRLVLQPAEDLPAHGSAGQRFEAICFGRCQPLPALAAIAYRLQRDDWQAMPRLSLVVVEVFEG